MNKIQTIKNNSKKGFTLVELVVVIAILAILAAIAIPVVSSTIESSQRSSALSNAQTLELALKEAHAQLAAGDYSVYSTNKATTQVSEVYTKKALKDSVKSSVTIGGKTYNLVLGTDEKVYYVHTSGATSTSVDGTTTVTIKQSGGANVNITSTSTAQVMSLF